MSEGDAVLGEADFIRALDMAMGRTRGNESRRSAARIEVEDTYRTIADHRADAIALLEHIAASYSEIPYEDNETISGTDQPTNRRLAREFLAGEWAGGCARCSGLEAALCFYANEDRYEYDETCCPTVEFEFADEDILGDRGERARTTLRTRNE